MVRVVRLPYSQALMPSDHWFKQTEGDVQPDSEGQHLVWETGLACCGRAAEHQLPGQDTEASQPQVTGRKLLSQVFPPL